MLVVDYVCTAVDVLDSCAIVRRKKACLAMRSWVRLPIVFRLLRVIGEDALSLPAVVVAVPLVIVGPPLL